MKRIRATVRSLSAKPNRVFASIAIVDGKRVVGYMSAVRAFERTCAIQHLAGETISESWKLVNVAATEFLRQLGDVDFFKVAFFSGNRWAARVFGNYAKQVSDNVLSDLRNVHVVEVDSAWEANQEPQPPATVKPVTSLEDLVSIERYFLQNEPRLVVEADDLTVPGFRFPDLERTFKRLGVDRTRQVLGLYRRNSLVAFALVEESSPGLNVQDQFCSAKLYTFETTDAESSWNHRHALVRAIWDLWKRKGRDRLRLFVDAKEVGDYATHGFQVSPQVSFWTCHRSLFLQYMEHVSQLLGGMMRRRESRLDEGTAKNEKQSSTLSNAHF